MEIDNKTGRKQMTLFKNRLPVLNFKGYTEKNNEAELIILSEKCYVSNSSQEGFQLDKVIDSFKKKFLFGSKTLPLCKFPGCIFFFYNTSFHGSQASAAHAYNSSYLGS
jgi:hypothetical protein